ncbi:Na+/H+ antiporter subunit G [Microvirga arabica]|uniref:Na+/H+ antiporter subunit G n=1 Tax=Microvirga arabica TaxID=1128671 RepID=A0ABV6YAL7_9HYPH|nr:Na+/H+ antiporter subunit G [Microvirga arabica]
MVIVEVVISLLVLVGSFFLFVGSLGLAKLPDLMRRLHGPTKATTLGIGSMLIASMLYFWAVEGNPSIHELLITLFLFLTAPVTAQMIAKAHILRETRERKALPDTGRSVGWATLDPAEADERSEVTRTISTP